MAKSFETSKRQAATKVTTAHQYGGWSGFIARYRAKRQARTIMRSLAEADQIHAGKRQAKTLDDFIDEL